MKNIFESYFNPFKRSANAADNAFDPKSDELEHYSRVKPKKDIPKEPEYTPPVVSIELLEDEDAVKSLAVNAFNIPRETIDLPEEGLPFSFSNSKEVDLAIRTNGGLDRSVIFRTSVQPLEDRPEIVQDILSVVTFEEVGSRIRTLAILAEDTNDSTSSPDPHTS